MVDYSRAATSRAAKSSFDQAAQSLIAEIQALQAEYETEWKKVEELRKSRASLIENVIPILKSNEVKLARPLSKCDNRELMEELSDTVNSLDTTPQEEIRVAMVRIESRYDQLVKQAKKLDALYERLSSYYVPEKDYSDEVVVSIKNTKRKKSVEANEAPSVLDYQDDVTAIPQIELEQREDEVNPEVREILSQVDGAYEDEYFENFFNNGSIELDEPIELDIDETPLYAPPYSRSSDEDVEKLEHEPNENAFTGSYGDNENDNILYLDSNEDEIDFNAVNEYLNNLENNSDDNLDNLSNVFASDDEALLFASGEANDGLEQVISSTPASKELIEAVESLIDSKKLYDYIDSFAGDTSTPEIVEIDLSDKPADDVVVKINLEDKDNEPEFHTYSLNNEQTLSQIVDYVYEGNLTWYDLYRYADNEELITKRCEELNMDIEDAANTPGVLSDLELKYPKNFTPYEETKSMGKAA